MGFRMDIAELAIIEEATKGTAEAAPSDGTASTLRVFDLNFAPEIEMIEIDQLVPHGSQVASLPGMSLCSISFKTHIRRIGSADAVQVDGSLLKSCGFDETVNAATSVVYKPSLCITDHETLTMYLYRGTGCGGSGLRHGIRGASGNVKMIWEAGKIPYYEWSFTGFYISTADAALNTVTYEAGTTAVWGGASLTFGGAARQVRMIEVDMRNEISPDEDANATGGVLHHSINRRRPGGTIHFAAVLVATENYFGHVTAGTEKALAFAHGAIAYSMPKVQILKVTETDINKRLWLSCDYKANTGASGDDELVITLT